MRRSQAFLIDHDHLARFDVANVLRVDQIKRTRFRGDDPRVAQPSQREWTKAALIANRNQFRRRQEKHRKRAFRLAQNFRYRFANDERERATPCSTTSVSEVDEKIAPSRSSRSRSSRANGRLPL